METRNARSGLCPQMRFPAPPLRDLPVKEAESLSPLALGFSMVIDYKMKKITFGKHLPEEASDFRLPLRLHRLGLAEGRRALLPPALRVQGVGPGRPVAQPLEGIAAAVGQLDALLAERHGACHGPQGQGQLAEVAGLGRGVLPILLQSLQ